ncbi:MAG: acyl-CoA dehydrogenase family protein [Deltaproteobacteria bacterium]|nr:acyl-CoA dehydrogenase family protein [Deltaproteobacteria bacterium]MBW2414187.1 acyl-CoA dehydrogenase family protein [Deltaproteobacteria bacterium]
MQSPLSPKGTESALERVAPILDKAIAHARGRDIDEQQVAVARLADLATELRAARDLLAYSRDAGQLYQEQAAVFAGIVVSKIAALPADHAAEHGLDAGDLLDDSLRDFVASALDEARVRAIGVAVAEARGGNEWPLDEMLELTREAVREFAQQEVMPRAEQIHRTDSDLPEEFIEKMGELGYFGLSIPEEFGGSEMGNVAMIITTEELSRASLAAAGSLITRPEILAKALLAGGTDDQKKTWLPKLASGELMVGISVTEPDIGSDVAAVKCRAERATVDGVEGWEITGPKAWCTFAGRADILAVLLRTDPDLSKGRRGLSLFIVPKPRFAGHEFEHEQPGGGRLSGKADATPGYRGMHSFTLAFERYFVPAENVVGGDAALGRGFYLQMGGFAAGRLQTGGRACGVAQGALEETARYVVDRRQFGRRLLDFQLTQYRLGLMAVRLAGARAMTYSAAAAMDEDERAAAPYAAQAKLLACRVAVDVTQQGQMLFGGWGYAEEYPISRYVVDAQVLPIFEGVEPVLQLRVVGQSLLAG